MGEVCNVRDHVQHNLPVWLLYFVRWVVSQIKQELITMYTVSATKAEQSNQPISSFWTLILNMDTKRLQISNRYRHTNYSETIDYYKYITPFSRSFKTAT